MPQLKEKLVKKVKEKDGYDLDSISMIYAAGLKAKILIEYDRLEEDDEEEDEDSDGGKVEMMILNLKKTVMKKRGI